MPPPPRSSCAELVAEHIEAIGTTYVDDLKRHGLANYEREERLDALVATDATSGAREQGGLKGMRKVGRAKGRYYERVDSRDDCERVVIRPHISLEICLSSHGVNTLPPAQEDMEAPVGHTARVGCAPEASVRLSYC